MHESESKQMYLEREFHRVVLERDNAHFCMRLWFVLAVIGWGALATVVFKADIIQL